MSRVQRFDSVRVKAHFDDNGFLVDRPIVARIGLQEYRKPDGTIRREFRPASEVFKSDALESFAGKPITLGHVVVTPDNADSVVVGACAGAGARNGIGVEVPISVYSQMAIDSAKKKRTPEISVGYGSVDIEEPGWGSNETGEYVFKKDMADGKLPPEGWVEFDAIQTDISVNHVAMVFRGRAGIAKLNLDGEQDFPYDDDTESDKGDNYVSVKIKLDGEQEFEVPEAVAKHIEAVKAESEKAVAAKDAVEAERDALKAQVEEIQSKIEEAVAKAKADADEFAELKAFAKEAGVKLDGLETAKDVKVAFIKEATGKDVSTKSDAYIEAAFDFAKESDKMADQRAATTPTVKADAEDAVELNPNARLAKLIK